MVTPQQRALGGFCLLPSARRRVQTSTSPVQLIVGMDVGKWLLLKEKKDHLRLTEAVEDSEETVEGRKNSCTD